MATGDERNQNHTPGLGSVTFVTSIGAAGDSDSRL